MMINEKKVRELILFEIEQFLCKFVMIAVIFITFSRI